MIAILKAYYTNNFFGIEFIITEILIIKKIIIMKRSIHKTALHLFNVGFFYCSFLLLTAIGFASCNSDGKNADTKEVAEDKNEAKFDKPKEDDAAFLVSAAEINLEEIDLGNLAQQKATMAEVKDLGKMMQTEHSKALSDLQALAAKKQITIPSSLTEKNIDTKKDLNEKTGMNFDKKYCDMMVDGHKEAIDKFEKAASNANDEEVRTWAKSMLPSLRTHLEHSITCQKNCEKSKM